MSPWTFLPLFLLAGVLLLVRFFRNRQSPMLSRDHGYATSSDGTPYYGGADGSGSSGDGDCGSDSGDSGDSGDCGGGGGGGD